MCGLAAALITKFFIILLTNLMRHARRDKIYLEYYDSTKARNMVKFNTIRYWIGVGLCCVIICKKKSLINVILVISFIFVIIFSS